MLGGACECGAEASWPGGGVAARKHLNKEEEKDGWMERNEDDSSDEREASCHSTSL